jgi:hypothetical protein
MYIPVYVRQDLVSEQHILLELFLLPALAFAQGSHIEYIFLCVCALSCYFSVVMSESLVLVQHMYVDI